MFAMAGKGLLEGKRGIIFGALDQQSIAWKAAQAAVREGAQIVLTNTALALRMGELKKLAEETGAEIIPADVTSEEDLTNLINKSQEVLGGKMNFMLHSIGMSPNVRKKRSYTDLDYNFFLKTLDISAISLHRLLQISYKLDALEKEASVVALTFIAAQRVFPDYSDMAQAKATLESIVRSFGYTYGMSHGVRVNSISQSPTPTTAGSGVGNFDKFLDFANSLSPLGNASAEDCANYIMSLFSDYTSKVTMQNLFHDGGFSATGMTPGLVERLYGEA